MRHRNHGWSWCEAINLNKHTQSFDIYWMNQTNEIYFGNCKPNSNYKSWLQPAVLCAIQCINKANRLLFTFESFFLSNNDNEWLELCARFNICFLINWRSYFYFWHIVIQVDATARITCININNSNHLSWTIFLRNFEF